MLSLRYTYLSYTYNSQMQTLYLIKTQISTCRNSIRNPCTLDNSNQYTNQMYNKKLTRGLKGVLEGPSFLAY